MALYPKADLKLLAENATQAAITPRLTIMHTALDGMTTTSLKGWWDNPNSKELESHFYVQRTGGVEQYMDTQIWADANKAANGFAVSVETWDGRAPDKPANPWNDAQVLAIIELNVWLCRTHGIPARLADRWNGSGIGFHNQFLEWSVGGTSCPGTPRRDQLINVIIPAVAKLIAPAPAPTRKQKPMPWSIVRLNDGRLCRFTTYLGAVTHAWQPAPNAGPWSAYAPLNNGTLPGAFDSVTAAVNADGRCELIAWHSAYGVPFTCWQKTPGGEWSGWVRL